MKKHIFPILSFLIFSGMFLSSCSQNMRVKEFAEDATGIFCNPERGWHRTFNPDYETNTQYPVYTREQLQKLRDEHITLVDKYYLIMPYKHIDLPQFYLDSFQADMDLIREVGLKAIVRWAYNYAGDKDMTDAPVEQILRHLEQLKLYLEKNMDVIALMEAGFIGKWAEWHGSEHNLGGEWHVGVNDNTRAIYRAIMAALPRERMVAIRYISQIQTLTGNPDCEENPATLANFTEEEAFSGSNLARTGRHDDWVFGDAGSNVGTWSDDPVKRECQKAYLEAISKYVPITTGETQTLSDFGRKNSPIHFFERFHFTSLSINPGSEETEAPIRLWKSNGVFDEMARRFGYRFVLQEASFPETCKENGNLELCLKIINRGFGGVFNPRGFELILRNTGNGSEQHLDLRAAGGQSFDPRFWFREKESINLGTSLALTGIPKGEYQLLLNLPDPTEKLYGRPEFSIRLANLEMWEEETGYNDLGMSILIK